MIHYRDYKESWIEVKKSAITNTTCAPSPIAPYIEI